MVKDDVDYVLLLVGSSNFSTVEESQWVFAYPKVCERLFRFNWFDRTLCLLLPVHQSQ
jgi:hypothetical protein